jgi:hypothetical protein
LQVVGSSMNKEHLSKSMVSGNVKAFREKLAEMKQQ